MFGFDFLNKSVFFDADKGNEGGDSDGQDQNQPTDGDNSGDGDNNEQITMTQAELNRSHAERAKQAKSAELKRIAELLGVEDIETAKSLVETARETEKKNRTDLENAQTDLTAEQTKTATLTAERDALKLQLEFEHKVTEMGLKFANTKSAEIAFSNLDLETVGDDYEGMEDAITKLQEDVPNLFALDDEEPMTQSRTQTDGRKKGTGNQTVTNAEAIARKRRAVSPL